MTSQEGDGRTSPALNSVVRRPRAPTITIDTTAVSPSKSSDEIIPLQTLSDPRQTSQGEQVDHTRPQDGNQQAEAQSSDLRPAQSFESKESRPISAHNISSPTIANNGASLLAVPGNRSRGNSVDSEDQSNSITSYSGETKIPSTATSTVDRQQSTAQNSENLTNDEDALKPDPGTEGDFEVTDNKFAFSPGQFGKLLNPKNHAAFYALGGLDGIEKGLRTDRYAGLSVDETQLDGTISFANATSAAKDIAAGKAPPRRALTRASTSFTNQKISDDAYHDRKRIFKDNRLPEKKSKSIFALAWLAFNDKVIILLAVAAVVSLSLGIYQAVKAVGGETLQWVEGVAIIVAIVLVVTVGAANDWQKERQFVKLNKKKDDRNVKVIRSGKSREISVHDILVGDVMHLEPGDMVPVDGIFISGHNVKCDESSATGESDLIKKHPGDTVYSAMENHQSISRLDPFIISGAKVTEGIGTFLVTAVGVNSSYGKTMMSLREDAQTTPLQSKLNVLAEYIAKLGLSAGLILFVATFIKFLVQLKDIEGGTSAKAQQFLNVFIIAVTIVVVAVPEGLPLAVTLALAFATTRMLKDNNLVRLLRACETMGNATTVCSDKTGTLTQNKMSTVACTLGLHTSFGDKATPDQSASSSPNTPSKGKATIPEQHSEGHSAQKFTDVLEENCRELLKESIAINSTAFEGEVDGVETFVGSKTETALLEFARQHLGMGPVNEERENSHIVQLVPFDSGRKCMAAVIQLDNGRYRMLVKGASEILLGRCSKIVENPSQGLTQTPLTSEHVEIIKTTIDAYASRSLRTIGIIYKDYEQWPPQGAHRSSDDPKQAVFESVFHDLVYFGVAGLQDPLRHGVAEAVKACQDAGVFVRMVTGDNLLTAKAIAAECGIYTPGGVIMEGPVFRNLTDKQKDQTIPNLQVLARSSPGDKRELVERLKKFGETVAVTGDGTNDAPALKTADVGFSMGIAGTEVAKEASAIILMDDNFASIVKAIMWGRAVNDAVKKFLQFQVTVNITAVFLTFISAVADANEDSVLTAVQLLWVNLIMDTFAALALATDPPTRSILNRKPEPKSAPLITLIMWKMIIGQSIFQLIVTLVLNFGAVAIASPGFFHVEDPGTRIQADADHRQMQTFIFNTFVWMQIFNQYNNRRLDNKFNIFEGVSRNWFFIGIQFIIVAGQVMIIFVGGSAFSVQRLNGPQWGWSVALGFLSIPMAILIRSIPDHLIRKCIPKRFVRKAAPQVLVSDEDQHFEWNPDLVMIREELSFIKAVRGGRLNLLAYRLQRPKEIFHRSRSPSRSRTNSTPTTPVVDQSTGPEPKTPDSRRSMAKKRGRSRSNSAFGPAAAMAGVVAGSIAGWSPNPANRRGEDEDAKPLNRDDLESRDGVEVHPKTSEQDPVLVSSPSSSKVPPSQQPEGGPHYGQNLAPPTVPGHRKSSSTSTGGSSR